METPLAHTLGFVLPSKVGPLELNEAKYPLPSTAPQAIMLSASAGASKVPGPGPEFPMALHTTIPLSAAMSAAMVVTAVLPSKSE